MIMKDNMEQHLDKLSKKIVKGQEFSLPEDFTQQVMNEVNALPSATEYKPLISKKAWFGITLVGVAVVLWTIISTDTNAEKWLDKVGVGAPKFNLGETLAQFQFSNVLLYSVVLFSVFVALQIALVKKQQSQQLQF